MYIEVRFHAERDIPSLGVRTGGWVEVDVSAAVAAVAVVALGGGGGWLVLGWGTAGEDQCGGQRKTGNPS